MEHGAVAIGSIDLLTFRVIVLVGVEPIENDVEVVRCTESNRIPDLQKVIGKEILQIVVIPVEGRARIVRSGAQLRNGEVAQGTM